MKHILLVLAIVALLGLMFAAVLVNRSRPASVVLADGTTLLVQESFVGPHRGPGQTDRPWAKWVRRLPGSIREKLPFASTLPSNSGRSWYHVPEDTNSFHVWLKRVDFMTPRPQLHERPVTITDADGWSWMNYGIAHAFSGGTSRVDYVNFSFAAFPRWVEFLDLEFLNAAYQGGKQNVEHLGKLRIRNPLYPATPVQWPVKTLPQTATNGNVQATLESVDFSTNRQWENLKTGTVSPYARLKLESIEQLEDRVVTNVWHEVVKSFYDNYGNNSHSGLPPRRESDTNAPPTQWRIAVDMVGDHRSRAASNHFVDLPELVMPSAGERAEIGPVTTNQIGALKLWMVGVFGAGKVEYQNGAFKSNSVPPNLPTYLQDSSGRSSDSKGNVVHELRLTSDSPHIAIGYDGKVEGTWFSMRAIDVTSGEVRWLSPRGDLSSRPSFHKVYNDPKVIWFNCKGLDTNRAWRFVFGAHLPQRFDFFIDRPQFVSAPDKRRAEFRAGAFAIDVTPQQFPVQLSGGILPVISTNVADPLHARSLVLDDGSTRIGLCILDNCLVSREYADQARAAMSAASGIPVERLTLACTHNHSSPALMNCHGSITDTNYARWLLPRLAEGMKQAVDRLEPARVGWAVTQAWEHAFNRRWVRRPDRIVSDPFGEKTARVQMNPGHESPDVIGPAGPKDPDLTLLAVETRDGRPLCVLANYANHYFGVGGRNVSADYFSLFGQKLGALLAARAPLSQNGRETEFVGIMSQGTSGDINRFDFASPRSKITMEEYAQEMAELAFKAYQTIRFRDWVPLAMRDRDLPMATRYPDARRLAWAREVVDGLSGRAPSNISEVYAIQQLWLNDNKQRTANVQALRVGELGIVMASAEVFSISGLKVKAQSPIQPAFWMTLANGNDGYIPPPQHHPLGGYTTWATRSSSLETNAEPVIVENILQMLEEVSGKPRRPFPDSHGPYAKAVLNEKPFAYWRLNEPDDNTSVAVDASENRRHATLNGGNCHYLPGIETVPGFTTGKPSVPNPFSGDRINRAVQLVDGTLSADLSGVGEHFSIELWFWNGLPNDARGTTAELLRLNTGERIGIGGTNQSPGVIFYRSGPTGRKLTGSDARAEKIETGNADAPLEVGRPISIRSWNHIIYAVDGRHRRLILNGEAELVWDEDRAIPDVLTLVIGGDPVDGTSFEGKLDEIAIYSKPLTRSEAVLRQKLAGFGSD